MSTRLQPKYTVAWLITLIVFSWSIASTAEEAAVDTVSETQKEESESTNALEDEKESLLVTGARLKCPSSFVNSPLRVANIDIDREAGLIDAAKVLQKATQTNKPRIVVVFGGSVSPLRTERSTFNSAAPVQVIDAKLERSFGNVGLRNVFQEPN